MMGLYLRVRRCCRWFLVALSGGRPVMEFYLRIRRTYRWLLAVFRLNLRVVCEESVGLPPHLDYHDAEDDIHGRRSHFVVLRCKRCGKAFYL